MSLEARFPVASDKVQISTATDAGDRVQNGVLIDGLATAVRGSTTGLAQWQNGLPLTATSQIVYVDATAGLPAGTTFQSGIPLDPAGAVCISTDAAAVYLNGLPHVANGALAAAVSA